MKYEIILGAQPNFDCHAVATYYQKDKNVKIFLQDQVCTVCNTCVINEDVVMHTLEHEMVETLCNWLRFEDGEYNIDPSGFDQMALKFRKKEATHICSDGLLRNCWWG